MSNIERSKSQITTGNKYIDQLPEKYREQVRVGYIIVLPPETNRYHHYLLITEIDGNKLYVYKYIYKDDIGKIPEPDSDWNSSIRRDDYIIDGNDFYQYYLKRSAFIAKNKHELNEYFETIDSPDFNLDEYMVDSISNDSALVHLGSSSHLEVIKGDIEQKANHLMALAIAMKLKAAEFRMALDEKRHEIEMVVSKMRAEITRIEKVLWTIELYLGIKENVVQIQEGNPANENEPLNIFQMCSYMDEEVANPEDQGIDMNSIDKFDDWLCTDNVYHKCKNYELLMYPRSVKMFKVRRNDKRYTENPIANSQMNAENHKTYILIRNGDQIYRIWADIDIKKFFPDQDEFQNMGGKNSYYANDPEKLEEELKDAFVHYQRHFIMLQGIIDRTEVFSPMPKFKLNENFDTGKFNYIYENAIKLPTERPLFADWLTGINNSLDVGSRIIYSFNSGGYTQERFGDQFYSFSRPRDASWGLPQPPEDGLYEIHETDLGDYKNSISILIPHIKEFEHHTDFNLPKRKRVSWRIYNHEAIINYDLCTLNDVEYYMYSHEDRKNYLQMMPLLINIKKHLLEDKKKEGYFIKMIVDDFKRNNVVVEEWMVYKAVDWWKTKNKYKRALTIDDSKAYRMIKKYLISKK
jgi:hypothetical protein